MKNIIRFFVTNYRFSFILSVLLITFGIYGLYTIKTETRPPVDFAQATITTSYPGASVQEVENEITRPIEKKLARVKGLDKVVSTSRAGLSLIVVFIDSENYDTKEIVDEIRREVFSLSGSDLPKELLTDPVVSYFDAKIIPILRLAFLIDKEPRKRMKMAYELTKAIEILPGVAGVTMNGYREEEVQIALNPDLLRKYYVDYTQVLRSINAHTQSIPSGYIRSQKEDHLIRLENPLTDIKQIENIIVRTNFSDNKILLKDIATVKVCP